MAVRTSRYCLAFVIPPWMNSAPIYASQNLLWGTAMKVERRRYEVCGRELKRDVMLDVEKDSGHGSHSRGRLFWDRSLIVRLLLNTPERSRLPREVPSGNGGGPTVDDGLGRKGDD